MELSGLRILGLAVGLLGLALTFFHYRGAKWRRTNVTLLFLFNAALVLVSINPNALNRLQDLLTMKSTEHGRILSLLVVAQMIVILALIYLKAKLDHHLLQFDSLLRILGKKQAVEGGNPGIVKPVTIVIPAYNERENLTVLVPRLPEKVNGFEVGSLIIDDGSTDGTAEIPLPSTCLLVQSPIHRGGGAALRLGFDILAHHGAEICITMDADNQHDPKEVHQLLEPLLQDRADIVIGSRVTGTNLTRDKLRRTGLRLFNFLISRLLKQKITDCSSGFRAFRTTVLHGVHLREDQYHTTELIIEAVKKGYRLLEVPITIHGRRYGDSKKGSDLRYTLSFAKVILKTWWR